MLQNWGTYKRGTHISRLQDNRVTIKLDFLEIELCAVCITDIWTDPHAVQEGHMLS